MDTLVAKESVSELDVGVVQVQPVDVNLAGDAGLSGPESNPQLYPHCMDHSHPVSPRTQIHPTSNPLVVSGSPLSPLSFSQVSPYYPTVTSASTFPSCLLTSTYGHSRFSGAIIGNLDLVFSALYPRASPSRLAIAARQVARV